MTQFEIIHVACFNLHGELESQQSMDRSAIDPGQVEFFQQAFSKLSGDLDLPLEVSVSSQLDSLVLRICSDQNQAAYTVYYFQEEAVFASLLLPGRDQGIEDELMQVLRFLLLDSSDEEEPDEAAIEEILSAAEFRFETIDARPVTIQIPLFDDPSIQAELEQIMLIDQQVAAAFFDLKSAR